SRDVGLREALLLHVSDRHALSAGFEARSARSELHLTPGEDLGIAFPRGFGLPAIGLPWHDHPQPFDSRLAGHRLAAWAEDGFTPLRALKLVLGLRLDRLTPSRETLVSP